MSLDLEFADRLVAFRKLTKHMTQEEAAVDAHIPLSTYRIAEGGRFGVKTARRLTAWLEGRKPPRMKADGRGRPRIRGARAHARAIA